MTELDYFTGWFVGLCSLCIIPLAVQPCRDVRCANRGRAWMKIVMIVIGGLLAVLVPLIFSEIHFPEYLPVYTPSLKTTWPHVVAMTTAYLVLDGVAWIRRWMRYPNTSCFFILVFHRLACLVVLRVGQHELHAIPPAILLSFLGGEASSPIQLRWRCVAKPRRLFFYLTITRLVGNIIPVHWSILAISDGTNTHGGWVVIITTLVQWAFFLPGIYPWINRTPISQAYNELELEDHGDSETDEM